LAGDKWWKYDAIHGWQDYTTRIVSGINTKEVTLKFIDGGFGDADGVANGIIVDPSGPGRPAPVDVDPVLSVTPDSLDFGNVIVGQSSNLDFTVTNVGVGALTGSASVEAPFSIVSGSPFSLGADESATVAVRFSPTATGSFSQTVAFTSNGGNLDRGVSGTGIPLPVPVLGVEPDELDFGTVDTQKTFDITNIGTGTLTWSITADKPWITVSPASGSTAVETDTITVTVDRAGLPIGIHQGVLSVTSNDGNATVRVSMEVPGVPVLEVTPTLLDFGTEEAKKTFTIANTGTGTLRWEIGIPEVAAWLTVSPDEGDTTTETDTITVTVSRRGLTPGPYFAYILVKPEGLSPQVVRVTMEVGEPPEVRPIVLGFAEGDIKKMVEAVAEVYLINPKTGFPSILVVTNFADLGIGEGYRAGWLIWKVEDGIRELILQVPAAAENMETALWGQTEHLEQLPLTHGILEAHEGQTYEAELEIVNTAIQTVAKGVLPFRTVATEHTDDIDEDGVPDKQKIAEHVDMDRDGVDDRAPGDHIAALRNMVTGVDTAVHVVEHEIADAPKVDRVEILDAYGLAPPLGYSFPEGMYSFRIKGLTPGSEIKVRFYLSKPFLAGDKWWKYDAIHGWQDYTTRIVSGIDTKEVTLRFIDGGFGDADGVVVNGIIVDPSGPGRAEAPAPAPAPVPVDDVDRLCFIATAAFGTPLAEEVEVLSRLRDEHLLTNELGQRFVAFYYRNSPRVAEFIRDNEWAKKAVRIALWPLVKIAEFKVGEE
jgi:hypothetical protein